MITWAANGYSISKAENDFNNLTVLTSEIRPINLDETYLPLRQSLLDARDEIYLKNNYDEKDRLGYNFDLEFGLSLYQILNKENGFDNRVATNDDVWRFLSIRVIPDIVHPRWGLNADHFYRVPRRIWLKTIWWYIHLAWQGNAEATYQILKDNNTDTILQIVERPGLGYNLSLTRALFVSYDKFRSSDRDILRRALKLNVAKLTLQNPDLLPGGYQEYTDSLFSTVKKNANIL